MKRIFYSIVVSAIVVSLAILTISYGRGYRFNLNEKTVSPTGILSASSSPDGASIIIDGKLTSATDTSLILPPGWHTVKITKEGYVGWEKDIKILGEVVSTVYALLIPKNPSLRSVTSTGIVNPSISPSGSKVAYLSPETVATESGKLKSKRGVWALDIRSGPLGRQSDLKQLYITPENADISSISLFWSPDEKNLLIGFKNPNAETSQEDSYNLIRAVLISTESTNPVPSEVGQQAETILKRWHNEQETIKKKQLESILEKDFISLFLNSTTNHKISPDETKILYRATASATLPQVITPPLIGSNPTEEQRELVKDEVYIYDVKEDKNFLIDQEFLKEKMLDQARWHADSKHILAIEKDTIVVIDYDGTNKRTVYAGPFEKNFLLPYFSSSRLLILTNLNNTQNLADFYELDLR